MQEPITLESKVVQIQGMRFDGTNASDIIAWVIYNGGTAIWWPTRTHDRSERPNGTHFEVERKEPLSEHIEVDTLDAKGKVFVGDWMLRGLKGEFYPCKDDTKVEKYNEVDLPDIIATEEPS